LLISLLTLVLVACAPIPVRTDWKPDASQRVQSWHTYRWLQPPKPGPRGPRPYTAITHGKLMQAVDHALQDRGCCTTATRTSGRSA